MKGDPSFVILKHSAWLDTSKYESQILGSIIRQPLRPTNDFVPSDPLQYNAFDLVEPTEPLTDFVLENTGTDTSHATAKLSSIAHLNFEGETTESVKLAGKSITYKRLQQHSQFWDKLKVDKAVIDKVPTWVKDAKGRPPCLVVGIMIAEDVELDFSGASKRETDGGVEIPIAKIAMAVTSAPLPPDLGNISAGASTAHTFASVFKAKTAKSNIFALELQKVEVARSSGWWGRKKQLFLTDDAPVFDNARLMGREDDDSDDGLPTVNDLEIAGYSEKAYARASR
jgi:hypothetical protein